MGRMTVAMVIVVACLLGIASCAEAQLKLGFYAQSCPKAEQIVLDYIKTHIAHAPSLAAAILRMHFHDCFVRGCDGSILLNSTKSTRVGQTEKFSPPNLSLRGFSFIDGIKAAVEKACPGVVSCADILALAARDSVVAIGGPSWRVPTGRRDGTISNINEPLNNLPPPTFNFANLTIAYAGKGLNVNDLILLSGAHTIGVSHCTSFTNRLYNFTGKGDQDPALDPNYAFRLKRKCVSLADNITIVEMDPGSFKTFDLSYFKILLKSRGLFQSDNALITNAAARSFIVSLVNSPPQVFFQQFAASMEKMGRIAVKTGSVGEIRRTCAFVN